MDLTKIERILSIPASNWSESEADDVLEFFYEKLYQWVVNVCYHRNVNPSDIQDIIQCLLIETFAKKIYKPSDDVNPINRFESLIRSHTRYCLGNYFKGRKELNEILLEDQVDQKEEGEKTYVKEFESNDRSPEEQAEITEFSKIISDCLQTLPEKLREAVRLRDIEELNYKEMLLLTDAQSENTLRQRVNRGRKAMKECIEKKGINLN